MKKYLILLLVIINLGLGVQSFSAMTKEEKIKLEKQIQEAYDKNDEKKALLLVAKYVKEFPNNADYLNKLGVLYDNKDDNIEAEKWYLKAIDNGSFIAISNLANLYIEKKEYEKSVKEVYDSMIMFVFGNVLNPTAQDTFINDKLLYEDYKKLNYNGNETLYYYLQMLGYTKEDEKNKISSEVEPIISKKWEEVEKKLFLNNPNVTIEELETLLNESIKFFDNFIIQYYSQFSESIANFVNLFEPEGKYFNLKAHKILEDFLNASKIEDSTKKVEYLKNAFISLYILQDFPSWFNASLSKPVINTKLNIAETTASQFIDLYKKDLSLLVFESHEMEADFLGKKELFRSEPYDIIVTSKQSGMISVKYKVRCINTIDSANPNDIENQLISKEIEEGIFGFKAK